MEIQYRTHSKWELFSVILLFIYTTKRLLYFFRGLQKETNNTVLIYGHTCIDMH